MISKIQALQSNSMYRINPINFLGNQPKQALGGNTFNSNNMFAQQNNNGYNLNHPKVAGSPVYAKSIDFLA